MPEHATGSRAAKGDLASRIDSQLPKKVAPNADLYVEAADGGPHAAPDRAATTILLAWHDCGKVVAAMVSRPEWPEEPEHRAEFKARQAGRSITEVPLSMVPLDDDWCRCFRD